MATLKSESRKVKLISGLIDAYLKLNPAEIAEFEAEVKALALEQKEHVMEIVTSWMEDGLKQGRREGRQQGQFATDFRNQTDL